MKKLSVIIISYNEKKYLPFAIESCLNQENIDFEYEIIIGDDGSSDGSIDVINAYKEKYPDIIRSYVMDRDPDTLKNTFASVRVSNLIKRGIEISEGEYIICLSGDDYFCDKNKFKNQVGFLEKNPTYIADISGFKKVYDSGESEDIREVTGNYSRSIFWSGYYIHISAFVFRRSVYDEGYFLNTFCDDTGLIYSIACAGNWNYRSDITLAYRQREKSIMHDADKLELNIVELLLFDDCMSKGKYKFSSLARFYKPLKGCLNGREHLSDKKYDKYYNGYKLSEKNSVLNNLKSYNELSVLKKLALHLHIQVKAAIAFTVFKVLRKIIKTTTKVK